MDHSSRLLTRDNHLPIHVFDFEETGAKKRICSGESIGTLIHDGQTNFAT
jgi:uridylate kinase